MKNTLMSAALMAAILSPISALSCDDHHGVCEIEDWKYWHIPAMSVLGVEGVTTCDQGWIRLRLYENGEFVGTAEGSIEGHTFTASAYAVDSRPITLEIKYSINLEG